MTSSKSMTSIPVCFALKGNQNRLSEWRSRNPDRNWAEGIDFSIHCCKTHRTHCCVGIVLFPDEPCPDRSYPAPQETGESICLSFPGLPGGSPQGSLLVPPLSRLLQSFVFSWWSPSRSFPTRAMPDRTICGPGCLAENRTGRRAPCTLISQFLSPFQSIYASFGARDKILFWIWEERRKIEVES
jgi:hypothetical protein